MGDEIAEFGSVNSQNFQSLQNIATVVQHSENVSGLFSLWVWEGLLWTPNIVALLTPTVSHINQTEQVKYFDFFFFLVSLSRNRYV